MALNETQPHAGGFIVSEANGTRSRSIVTIKSGEDLEAGAVVQKEESTGKYIAYDAGNSDIAEGPGSVAILFEKVDASAADKDGVVVDNDAEVNGDELKFADDQATGDKEAAIAALAAVGIKLSPGHSLLT
jgi:hypothetical protein